jgi:hypothetical protein
MAFGGFGAAAQQASPYSAARASVDARAAFLVKTYLHLAGAVFAFVALETVVFALNLDLLFFRAVGSLGVSGNLVWLGILALFMVSGFVARRMAMSATSPLMAYGGLALEVVTWAVVFILPLTVAVRFSSPDVLPSAVITTLLVFGGLTGIVFVTRKDFSFMRGILGVASIGAFAVIICSLIFGFQLGIFFMGAMVVLAGGYILYDTSNVLHHFRTDQHVPAALVLFSSLAFLFWYVLQIFMSRD